MPVLGTLLAVNSAVYAESAAYREQITLEFYASEYISLNKKISRVFVGSSGVISVKQPSTSPNEFVITAKDKKGSTTLFIWTADGARYEYLINVVDEEIGQAAIIEKAINLPNVHVKKVGQRILLTGTVQNQYERNYALQTARLYVKSGGNNNLSVGSNVDMQLNTSSATSSGSSNVEVNALEDAGEIIDLLEMANPLQIRLEAQVIEISSDKAKDLGITYGESGSGGVFTFGEDHDRTNKTRYYRSSDGSLVTESYSDPTDFRNNPIKWVEQRFGPINATIHALVTKGDAHILSRPNITTMSGEQATIQIGGQIPYTVSNANGSTTNFKDYGIILQFKPVIDAQNRITSVVHTEVSNLSGQTVDGQPIIATRRADSVINIDSGSTMVIGGLMDSTESKSVSKIPLLGDIPILGEFFKYTTKSRDKRELIIVITPYIMGDGEVKRAGMSDELRDLYHAGQRDKNNLNDVDLNALPPPFEEKKKDKKSNANKSQKQEKPANVEINTSDENPDVEIFGDAY